MTLDATEIDKRIREIHVRDAAGGHAGVPGGGIKACGECFRDWPCPTIAALTATETDADEQAPTAYASMLASWGGMSADG